MKYILSIIAFCSAWAAHAQQVVIKHTYYTSYFNEHAHIPDSVVYDLTADMVSCTTHLKRQNGFTADPAEPGTNYKADYAKSGYDCGHQMSAEDNACNATGMHECFYFTNMCPQSAKLNRGVWKALETKERALAAQYGTIHVKVWQTGNAGTIGPDSVVIPAFCWKEIDIPSSDKVYIYKFPNTTDVAGKPADFIQ